MSSLKISARMWNTLKFTFYTCSRFDYSVNADRSARFYPEIRKYYPNLKDGSLEPGYSGIRPKLCGPRQSPQDFLIQVGYFVCILTYLVIVLGPHYCFYL